MGWRTDWARERVRVRTERKTTDKKQKIHVCGRFAKRTAFFYSIEKSHTFFTPGEALPQKGFAGRRG